MKNHGGLFLLVIMFGFYDWGSTQPTTPLLFLTPKQLVVSSKALEGQRVKMEVAFGYRASIQLDSAYQKCTMEGKFRETHRLIDQVVFYNIFVPNAIFVKQFTYFQSGEHLTIIGKAIDVDGPFTKIIIEEVKSGWLSDCQKVLKDTTNLTKAVITDSLLSLTPPDSLIQKPEIIQKVKKDTSFRKKVRDSSWVK